MRASAAKAPTAMRRVGASRAGRAATRAGATKTSDPPANLERLRIETPWDRAKETLKNEFGATEAELKRAESLSDEESEQGVLHDAAVPGL